MNVFSLSPRDYDRTLENRKVRPGDRLGHGVIRSEPPVSGAEIHVLHEDDDILVVDKPPTIPASLRTVSFQHVVGNLEHRTSQIQVVFTRFIVWI